MKKLFKYLDKIGADYRPEKYGNNYFYNVPEFIYEGAIVSFDYSDGDIQTHYMKMVQQEKMLKKYCDKYGYMYHSFGHFPGCFWFTVCKKSDYEKSDFLRMFERESQETCEKIMHDFHSGKCPTLDLEKALRDVMDSYGREYLETISKIQSIA